MDRWQKIEAIFEEAIKRSAADREAFLREACADDLELYGEVASLVAHDDATAEGSWASEAAAELIAPGSWPPSPDVNAGLTAGTPLGPYTIIGAVGAGAMGQVYRARDSRLHRDVAIKALPVEFARDAHRLRRFQREAQMLGSLNHANIAGIHDVLETNGGSYLVLEFVEGADLGTRVQAGPLPLNDVLHIGHQIAVALQAAHQKGIVHRDLKPANIKVTPDGWVKVLDFGVAKATAAPVDGREGELSQSNPGSGTRHETLFAGTPAYMSPEQADGHPVDQRADVWAFGCVLYELLTGQRAFAVATTLGRPASTLKTEPDWNIVPSGTPADLIRLIQRCLQREVNLRPWDAGQLRQAIEGISTAQGADTVRVGMASPSRRWATIRASRVGVWLILGVLLLFATLVTIGVARFGPRQPVQASSTAPVASVAILPFATDARENSSVHLGPGLTDALILRLHRLKRINVRPASAVASFGERSQDPVEFGRSLRVDAVLHGTIRQGAGRLRVDAQLLKVSDGSVLWAEQFEETASALFALEDSIATRLSGSLALRLTSDERRVMATAGTTVQAAHEAYLRGRYSWNQRTLDGLQKAVNFHEEAVRLDPGYALAYAGLADSYVLLSGYHFASQHEMIPKARAAAEKATSLDPTLAQPYTTLALIAMNYDWAWSEAERLYQKAIALNPQYATAHAWYGEYLVFMGRFDEGFAEFSRARELDPLSVIIATDVGKALFVARRYSDAIAALTAVLETTPNYRMALQWRGSAYLQSGQPDKTLADLTAAPAFKPEDVDSETTLIWFHAQAGRRSVAQQHLTKVLAIARKTYVSPIVLAFAYLFYGDLDRAFEWLERACDERSPGIIAFKLDPSYDVLRGDPRFDRLLRRVGFGQ